jgi:hypothetical protein
MLCSHCGKEGTNKSISQHIIRCKNNPSRIILDRKGEKNPNFGNKGRNQFILAREKGTNVKVSKETRDKLSIAGKNKIWTDENRKKHSNSMKKAVSKYPESYSASNVNGRTKKICYNGEILDGSWELEVAKWLDRNSIEWIKKTKGFLYVWEGTRTYFPDFYLPSLDLYLEVKGYERERDRIKWKSVKNLLVFKRKEIEKIKNNVSPSEIFC